MQVTLIKPWLNHPKGTIVKSVSPGIFAELKRLGCVEIPKPIVFVDFAPDVAAAAEKIEPEKKKKKSKDLKSPPADRMVKNTETKTEEKDEAKD
ncbi:hypothetical protein ES703_18833 [subsurface metagenome]